MSSETIPRLVKVPDNMDLSALKVQSSVRLPLEFEPVTPIGETLTFASGNSKPWGSPAGGHKGSQNIGVDDDQISKLIVGLIASSSNRIFRYSSVSETRQVVETCWPETGSKGKNVYVYSPVQTSVNPT